jgi:hypothetical protein
MCHLLLLLLLLQAPQGQWVLGWYYASELS